MKHNYPNQEAFNTIWKHFISKYHSFSFDEKTGHCVFRDPEGNRDPLGVLIPDSLWNPSMNKLTKVEDLFKIKAIAKYFKNVDTGLLKSLVKTHDIAFNRAAELDHGNLRVRNVYRTFRNTLRWGLEDLAAIYNLSIPSSRPYPTYIPSKKTATKPVKVFKKKVNKVSKKK